MSEEMNQVTNEMPTGTEQDVTNNVQENTQQQEVTENQSNQAEENANQESNEGAEQQQQPTEAQPPVDENALKEKLREYELKENELKELSKKMGLNPNQDTAILQAQTQLDILNNQAMQEYINICNEYGVDFRADKIDESAKHLYETDRNKYYDLQHKLGQLSEAVTVRRNELGGYIRQQQINNSLKRYNDMLSASPAMKQAVDTFIANVGMNNPEVAINGFFEMATPLYKEAFEYGKLYAQQQALEQKQAPETILNNNSIVQSGSANTNVKTLTMDEIEKMDLATYSKYASQIDELRRQGKL